MGDAPPSYTSLMGGQRAPANNGPRPAPPGASGTVPPQGFPPVRSRLPGTISFPALVGEGGRNFHITRCDVSAEVHIAVSFVTLNVTYMNDGPESNGILSIPMSHRGVMMSAVVVFGNRVYETMVISKEEALEYAQGRTDQNINGAYDPDLFTLPIARIPQFAQVTATVTYYEPLVFYQGSYSITIPMTFPDEIVTRNLGANSMLNLRVYINAGTPECRWGSSSHPMKTVGQQTERIELASDNSVGFINRDFQISYYIYQPNILASLIVEPPKVDNPNAYDPRGSFVLFASPPAALNVRFNRNVIFLLDYSGSMSGTPLINAKEALLVALDMLGPHDRFTITAFNTSQTAFSPVLLDAIPQNLDRARGWVSGIVAEGGTDILSPVRDAIVALKQIQDGVPYLFLITDGAVSNEQEICHHIAKEAGNVRVSTFGIGIYCNAVFLKMAAELGRGFHDMAITNDHIVPNMTYILNGASTPALTDVVLRIEGLSSCEIYPFPIPDLFVGAPLVVSGKFTGTFPASIIMEGWQPDGTRANIRINTTTSQYIPVNKIFVKQRIDVLTARAWLEGDKQLEQQVVDLSVRESVPCAHTVMVGYETTPQQHEARKAQERKTGMSGGQKVALLAVGGIAGIIIVGAALAQFGDLGGTVGNLVGTMTYSSHWGGNWGGNWGGGHTNTNCNCGNCDCGNCNCNCDSCCDLWQCCTSGGGSPGDCAATCNGLCSSCFQGIGNCCSAIGDCSCLKECVNLCGSCPNMCECAGACCQACGSCDCKC